MTTTLTTADGLALHFQEWPAAADARGTVLIVHGLGEHIGRYAHVAAQLNAWGWNVAGYDQRGHGRSEGGRGRVGDGDDLLNDLAVVIDALRTRWSGTLILLGHSMGGLIAGRLGAEGVSAQPAAAWYRDVDALVLSSPALDPGMNAVAKVTLTVMSLLAPNLPVHNGLQPAWISRDPNVVGAYQGDPLVHDRITARLAGFIVNSGRLVRARAAAWKLPTLLIYAGSDRCVSPGGSREFAAAAPPAVVRTQEFPTLFHEIMNEPEQAQVFAALGNWLAARSH